MFEIEPRVSNPDFIRQIKDHLQGKGVTTVTEVIEEHPYVAGRTTQLQFISILVAPKMPNYNYRTLNELLASLRLPGLNLSNYKDFRQNYLAKDGGFEIGYLCYDENMGEDMETHETNINDTVLASRLGITPRVTKVWKLDRRINIMLYPDVLVASLLGEYLNGRLKGIIEESVEFEELKWRLTEKQIKALKKKENPLVKLAGLLE